MAAVLPRVITDYVGSLIGINHLAGAVNKFSILCNHSELADKSSQFIDILSFPNTVYYFGKALQEEGLDKASYAFSALESGSAVASILIRNYFTKMKGLIKPLGILGDAAGAIADGVEFSQAYEGITAANKGLVSSTKGTRLYEIYEERRNVNILDLTAKVLSILCGLSALFAEVFVAASMPAVVILVVSSIALSLAMVKELYKRMGHEGVMCRRLQDKIADLNPKALVS